MATEDRLRRSKIVLSRSTMLSRLDPISMSTRSSKGAALRRPGRQDDPLHCPTPLLSHIAGSDLNRRRSERPAQS